MIMKIDVSLYTIPCTRDLAKKATPVKAAAGAYCSDDTVTRCYFIALMYNATIYSKTEHI